METAHGDGPRRVTAAEIEAWLGVEPGEKLTVPGSAFVLPSNAALRALVLVAAVVLLMMLLTVPVHGMPLALAMMYPLLMILSVCVPYAVGARRRAAEVMRSSLQADASGLVGSSKFDQTGWRELGAAEFVAGCFDREAGWPTTKGSEWNLSFAAEGGYQLTIRLTCPEAHRLVSTIRHLTEAKQAGCLLPGEPDPPPPADWSIPAGAISLSRLTADEHADRGLSRPATEPTSEPRRE